VYLYEQTPDANLFCIPIRTDVRESGTVKEFNGTWCANLDCNTSRIYSTINNGTDCFGKYETTADISGWRYFGFYYSASLENDDFHADAFLLTTHDSTGLHNITLTQNTTTCDWNTVNNSFGYIEYTNGTYDDYLIGVMNKLQIYDTYDVTSVEATRDDLIIAMITPVEYY
jgi:hypothetical protein